MILMKALWRVRGLTLSVAQKSEMQIGPVMLRANSNARCTVMAAGPPVQIVFPSVQQRQNGVKDHLLKLLRADVQIALACGIQHRNEYLPEPLDFMMVRLKGFSSPARQECLKRRLRQ